MLMRPAQFFLHVDPYFLFRSFLQHLMFEKKEDSCILQVIKYAQKEYYERISKHRMERNLER